MSLIMNLSYSFIIIIINYHHYYLALITLFGQLCMVYAFTTHLGCSQNVCTMLHTK